MDKVVHFDIPYDDKARAMKFYGEIFGWVLNDMGPKMGDYVLAQTATTGADHMVEDKGAVNGALAKRSKIDSMPRVYIQVASIEETLKKIEAQGGKQFQQIMEIPNGRMSSYTDSEGNIIGLVDYPKV